MSDETPSYPADDEHFPLQSSLAEVAELLGQRDFASEPRKLADALALVAARLPRTTSGVDLLLTVGHGSDFVTFELEELRMEWKLGGVAHGDFGSDVYTDCAIEIDALGAEDSISGDVLSLPRIAQVFVDWLRDAESDVSIEGSAEVEIVPMMTQFKESYGKNLAPELTDAFLIYVPGSARLETFCSDTGSWLSQELDFYDGLPLAAGAAEVARFLDEKLDAIDVLYSGLSGRCLFTSAFFEQVQNEREPTGESSTE